MSSLGIAYPNKLLSFTNKSHKLLGFRLSNEGLLHLRVGSDNLIEIDYYLYKAMVNADVCCARRRSENSFFRLVRDDGGKLLPYRDGYFSIDSKTGYTAKIFYMNVDPQEIGENDDQ